MKLFDITGFVAAVLGIAGLAGAIDSGTGLPQAATLTVIGCLMVYITYKERKENKDESNHIVSIDSTDSDAGTGTGGDSIRSGEGN